MLLLNRHPHGFSSPSQSHCTPGVVITLCGDETAPFFGFLSAVAARFFSCVSKTSSVSNVSPRSGTEAAYGTAKSGVVASMGVMRLELVMNSIVPVVMAVFLGLACGLAGLSAGMVIGFVGDTGVRANAQPPNFLLG